METTNKTVAGVQFTQAGISIVRPYSEDFETYGKRRIPEEKFTGDFVELAKRLAKTRMAHCYKQLHTNLAKATHITEQTIAWDGGCFQVPVYEALEGVLNITDVRKLNALQAQQLIRAMLIHSCEWVYDYDDNHNRISKADIRVTEDFKMFITEHLFCITTQQEC